MRVRGWLDEVDTALCDVVPMAKDLAVHFCRVEGIWVIIGSTQTYCDPRLLRRESLRVNSNLPRDSHLRPSAWRATAVGGPSNEHAPGSTAPAGGCTSGRANGQRLSMRQHATRRSSTVPEDEGVYYVRVNCVAQLEKKEAARREKLACSGEVGVCRAYPLML